MNNRTKTAVLISCGLSLLITACGGGSGGNSGGGGGGQQTTTYTLTVDSTAPASGVAITASPKDNSSTASGTTSFTLTYNAAASVTLTAPATSGSYTFVKWTGCTSTTTVTCSVTLNANTTVTANYNAPSIKSVAVTPNPETAIIGTQVQFAANVTGANNFSTAVTWSVLGPPGSSLSAGNITSAGLYTTPYPAPATVTVTATSVEDTTQSGSVVVTLAPPVTAAGPALMVDTTNQTHAISPYIYGWNDYQLDPTAAQTAGITVNRFGGDGSQRYNYLLDFSNSASDWWFENQVGNSSDNTEATGEFNTIVESNNSIGVKTLGTVDVLGWVSTNGTACSFPKSTYPNQTAFSPDRNGDCGNGVYPQGYPAGANACTNPSGCNITGNDPTLTSMAVGPSFAGDWVTYLVGKFGDAASGGVAIYDLDNEPAWWDAVHRDVHPAASTYDEVTNNGMAVAEAVKAADPTAEVSGPVVDFWWNYFYSKKDIENGWSTGPCYVPWASPIDRQAHGGVPFIEYYLQQFAAYDTTNSVRLLDYLDLHTYYAATYNGSGVGLTTAGDTGEQIARLNSTRVLWDPTYTDPNEQQPNYPTDANYGGATNCNPPLQAPQLIPMAKGWVAKDYPGTKIAFTEYNWGGQEHINGALAQADILGIFGAYGLDLATLWGPPDPTAQVPGLMAYEIYRNYDGKSSMFGDTSLSSSSSNQGKLSVYSAVRSSDNAITVVVINKTYGDLTSTLSLGHFTPNGNAKVFLYSAANTAAIVAQPDMTITPPSGTSTTSTIGTTFPASSITLFVIPQ